MELLTRLRKDGTATVRAELFPPIVQEIIDTDHAVERWERRADK